ncbi:MAG: HDOD domain-containing protein [Pseudomonadota bacterium]
MTESINTWVARLSPEPLPVMRRTLTRVKDLLDKSSASHTSLRDVIEFDPGFSLYVFRKLKSLPNQPKEPVSKLGNALSLLGMDQIKQASLDLPALEDRLKGPPRRGLLDGYSRAAHAAIYASELSLRLKFREAESLTFAALLHDVGEMALWNAAPEVMRQIQQLMQQGDSREDAALQVLGFTLEALNQKLSSRWQLPELTQESQELYNSFQPQPLTVMLACAVARDSVHSWTSQKIFDHLELLAEFLEISQEQAQAQLHQAAALAARKLHGLPLPLPAFRLVNSTGNKVSPPMQQTEAKSEPATTQPPLPAKAEKTAQPVHQKSPATDKKPAPKHNPLHESLTRTIDTMQENHGLVNVMFTMLSTDKTKLIARFVAGNQAQSKLKGFQVSLQRPSLFSLLMKKPQAIWLNPGNQEKYQQLLPEKILQQLCGKGFLVMSIFIKNKPVGLFYADNGCSNKPLTGDQYHNFKALCQRFMQELA